MVIADCGLPEEKLPQCWSDDIRMNALFAPFRLKSANPESWEMKMKFWSDMVRQWCRSKVDPIVSAADVKCAFQRRGRTAVCIDIVIEEMYRNGDLSPLSKYHQILHNGPEGWMRWGARLAFKPAAIALTAVTSLLPAKQATDSNGLPKACIDCTQRFVLESAVKDQATDFLNNFPPEEERIGTIEELMRITDYNNREVFEVYLGYLVSQGAAVKQGDVVKLAEPNKKVSPVTELDEALVKLMSTETRLSADVARLSRDVNSADIEVKAALKLGNRLAAKNHLRRKLKIQQHLNGSQAALENFRELLNQARNTNINAAVIDTYKKSAQAMKQTMKDGGLEENSVYDTMDNLKEVMDAYNEIEKALGGNLDDLDMSGLEQELNDLLSGPGNTGGTPGKEESKNLIPNFPTLFLARPKQMPKRNEKDDFVFDGEEQMLAELNKLSLEDASPGRKVAVAEEVKDASPESKPKKKPSQAWYPPFSESLSETWTEKLNTSLTAMCEKYGELRQDNRLHPGQALDVDFTCPPRHYAAEFQVRDHKYGDRLWLFNSKDDDLTASTEYYSSESPGKTGSNFQMAPGGERKKTYSWPRDDGLEDLEQRLKNLRGFKP